MSLHPSPEAGRQFARFHKEAGLQHMVAYLCECLATYEDQLVIGVGNADEVRGQAKEVRRLLKLMGVKVQYTWVPSESQPAGVPPR